MSLPERFLIHNVSYRPRLPGGGMYSDDYGDEVTTRGFAQISNHAAISESGEELVAETVLWLDPDESINEGALVTVTDDAGREIAKETSVLGVGFRDSPGSLSHLEVSLGFYRRGSR